MIYKTRNIYYLKRNTALGRRIAQGYAYLQQVDKGPWPYFTDRMKTMVYDDGERLEDEDELYGEEDGSQSVSSDLDGDVKDADR